ncbi:phosphoglucomutase [Chondrus crispus]|uniref:phosphoglucomutase (alpha-D-glucose-1,6-bisphosphate-dependent) n=1 Tax=Chondrus crispus TaxID=2769 RepID=R7QHD2_CHOCR|nr:phosphoglucomutase [Chondrus crispus]CDF37469.1 phosphoglucomutase [Chondrus crispus]|eukprot:XP_005717288.1 phosphoglucomutase [Chondrus crispus]
MTGSFAIKSIPTSPIDGQKTGTSGLRKKVSVFQQPNYLHNWVQSLFSSLDGLPGSTIALGGDGRYWNKDAIRIICRLAAANGLARVKVGHNGILCTPAISSVIRAHDLYGGIILTASHNPGGPTNDFGIKYNVANGGPAPETVTSAIFKNTATISEYNYAVVPDADHAADPFAAVDLSVKGETTFSNVDGPSFVIEVIDSADDYVTLLQSMFDFAKLKALFARPDFSFLFDAMNGVTGPYGHRIFVDLLGGKPECVMRGEPLEDFGGAHPDPNLTYAAELVAKCDPKQNPQAPDMGAASDGDGDRNMVLGKGFFVTPSDSVALIAAKAKEAIPYFKNGLKGVARSMPTAGALDRVAAELGIELHEVPTGWKYFGNLMDAERAQICGEESFGTGSDHVREKDGIFAVLCWLAIVAHESAGKDALVSIEDIVINHWKKYGRNFFSRYDYEEVETKGANAMMAHIDELQANMNAARGSPDEPMALDPDFSTKVALADNFSYVDPIDGSEATGQGRRFVFTDGSRVIFRLSGTGSSGATIRLYAERYEPDENGQLVNAQAALKPFIELALKVSKLEAFTGRREPTVIT